MKVQGSIDIAAPPEKIWPFMVDPEKILKWCITIQKFEYTGKHHGGHGTTIYFEEKAAGRLMKLHFKMTEWVEHKTISFTKTSGNFLKDYKQSWTIEATTTGSKFIFIEDIVLPYGIIGKIIGLFAKRSSEATVKKMLIKLKNLVQA